MSKVQNLLHNCVVCLQDYTDIVQVKDLSVSWNDGLALCCLVHYFKPNDINLDENFSSALKTLSEMIKSVALNLK